MRLSWNEIHPRAADFARDWADAGYEKGETETLPIADFDSAMRKALLDACRFDLEIAFAHRTFAWKADIKGMAHVHVVIVGLAPAADAPGGREVPAVLRGIP